MTTWRPDAGGHEVLSHGDEPPRRTARVWGVAAVCSVLGLLVGIQVDDALDDRGSRQRDGLPPALSAGVIQENPVPASDRRFAVPLYNGGSADVTVDSVEAAGWISPEAQQGTVTIEPGSWRVVPVSVMIDCAAAGRVAPRRLTVRTTTPDGEQFEQEMPMPATAGVLSAERARLCLDPVGSTPAEEDLVGSWLVEEAGGSRGTIVRLRRDGTFAIDPDVFRFGAHLDAIGSYERSGATLRLTAAGGEDCRPGDVAEWALTLLEDGRLHVRFGRGRECWCGVAEDEVWVARRIPDDARS